MADANSSGSASSPLHWIVASLGLSGLFAASGYIVRFSEENLLGVTLTTDSLATSNALEGARFLVDICIFIIQHPWYVAGSVAAVAAAAGLRRLAFVAPRHPRVRSFVATVLLLVAATANLSLMIVPALDPKNLLFDRTPLQAKDTTIQLPSALQDRANAFRKAIVCSRVECDALTPSEGVYRSQLDSWFGIYVFVTLALLVIGASLLSTWRFPSGQPWYLDAGKGLLALALVLNVLAVPVLYGRTLLKPELKELHVVFDQESAPPCDRPGNGRQPSGDPAQETGPAKAQGKTEIDGTNAPGGAADKYEAIHGFLLSEAAGRVTFYNLDCREIWSLEEKDIRLLEIRSDRDILASYFHPPALEQHQPARNTGAR
jgi:hypothetical protein